MKVKRIEGNVCVACVISMTGEENDAEGINDTFLNALSVPVEGAAAWIAC